jgi:hypothetical protein
MGPDSREEFLKPQRNAPGEEHEGLRILARIIAKAIIKDAQRKQTAQTQSENLSAQNS